MNAGAPSTIRILLVDDDEVDRTAVRRALDKTGLDVQVVEAADVASACRILSERELDCVLVDYCLPGGDGTDVIKAVAGAPAAAPVIVLTGRGDRQLAVELMKGGASDYIAKADVTPSVLASSIRRALRVARAERAEWTAHAEVERQALQLQHLAAASLRIHAATSVAEMLEIAAGEARVLILAHVAVVRLESAGADPRVCVSLDGRFPSVEAARAARVPWLDAALVGHDDAPLGTISVGGPPGGAFRRNDEPALRQLAQSAAIAIDKARLFKDAQDASRTRDDVLAIVSHDLRSPLHTISMSASRLREVVQGPERVLVERIERGTARMSRLLADLLDASCIDAGKLAVVPRRERAATIVREAVDSALPIATARACRLECGRVDEGTHVVADRQRILQVLSNVVGNAIKFSPADGAVVVGVEPRGDFAAFSVDDRGPGIAPEHVGHLFERYYKANVTSPDGAGLGLFIARGIVEAHGGRIRLDSERGRGTRVLFTIPLSA